MNKRAMRGWAARTDFASVKPSTLGMRMSVTIRSMSGCPCTMESASSPSGASSTLCPSPSSVSTIRLRTRCSSSTANILAIQVSHCSLLADERRQVDRNRRPLFRRTPDSHLTARLRNETVSRAQTEARALADRLGREERGERFRLYFRRHADARIGDFQEGEAARRPAIIERHIPRRDGNPPPGGKGVARVDHDIEDDVLHLVAIDQHLRPSIQMRLRLDILAQRAADEIAHSDDELVQVGLDGRERLLA